MARRTLPSDGFARHVTSLHAYVHTCLPACVRTCMCHSFSVPGAFSHRVRVRDAEYPWESGLARCERMDLEFPEVACEGDVLQAGVRTYVVHHVAYAYAHIDL